MRFCLLVSLLVLGHARLNQPGDSQQLAVSGAGAEANPEVDAWHAAEKAKIEAECNDMLMKLDREKRAKLQAIVDQKQRELDAELARLADAQRKTEAEMAELRKQKGQAEAEAAKVPPARAKAELEDAKRALADAKRRLADAEARAAAQKD